MYFRKEDFMKRKIAFFLIFYLLIFAGHSFASDIESRLNALEETIKQQGRTIDEQRKLIEELKAEVKQNQPSPAPGEAAINEPVAAGQMQQQVQELNEKVDQVVEAQRKVLPSEFNPSIGLVGETIFSYRSKGSSQTGSDRPGGFDAFQRSVELNAAASVDPFAKAYVVANASADAHTGESTFGIEEAALQTESLPWNLTVKAGRFFGEFGRLATSTIMSCRS